MSDLPSGPMSLREYAKHRAELGLVGKSATAVSKAIASGRLVRSVVRDHQGDPKIADAALADREWATGTDYSKAPGSVKEAAAAPPPPAAPGGSAPARVPRPPAPPRAAPDVPEDEGTVHLGMGLTAASAAEKVWKARIAELDFRERSEELVDAAAMKAKIDDAFTKVRTRLLGVPTRARQQIPHLAAGDIALLDSFIREALEELVVELTAPPPEEPDAGGAASA